MSYISGSWFATNASAPISPPQRLCRLWGAGGGGAAWEHARCHEGRIWNVWSVMAVGAHPWWETRQGEPVSGFACVSPDFCGWSQCWPEQTSAFHLQHLQQPFVMEMHFYVALSFYWINSFSVIHVFIHVFRTDGTDFCEECVYIGLKSRNWRLYSRLILDSIQTWKKQSNGQIWMNLIEGESLYGGILEYHGPSFWNFIKKVEHSLQVKWSKVFWAIFVSVLMITASTVKKICMLKEKHNLLSLDVTSASSLRAPLDFWVTFYH